MHRPIAAPSIPASASGVSTQRFGPNRSSRPAVARKTPPARPTSSPITSTFPSRSSSVCSASLTASTRVSSAIAQIRRGIDVGVLEEERRIGGSLRFRRSDPCAHQVFRVAPHGGGVLVGEKAESLQEHFVAAKTLARALLLDARQID